MQRDFLEMPDSQGYFGEYGGQLVPPELKAIMDGINEAYEEVRKTAAFQEELSDLYANYVGRPSPIFEARRLTARQGGARIFLKREDLNHTGADRSLKDNRGKTAADMARDGNFTAVIRLLEKS